jgi:AmmeMemoRadiSam system protein B
MPEQQTPPPTPRLRAIDIVPVQQGGQQMLLLRDPSGLAPSPVAVTSGMLLILRMLDGERTIREIQTAIARQTGDLVRSDQIERIIGQLDEALLLETPRLDEYRAQRLAEYRASGVRPCTHAEGAYPTEPEGFAQMVEGWLGALPPREAEPTGRLAGAIAPHIDFARGGVSYAHAYRDVAECDADLFVVLGTDHYGDTQFAATRGDYDTPLGRVKTSTEALDRLEASFIGDLFEGELQHLGEHTVEFQAVLLQHFVGGKRNFEVLPILCGGLGEDIEAGETEPQDAEVLSMIDCLRELLADTSRKVCLIASADLSHVGPRFGDNRMLTGGYLASVEQHDRAVLDHAVAGRPDEMFAIVSARRNDTNICGLAPIYIMLKTLGECRGELLDYRQAASPDRQQCVTFAAATFRE